MVIGDLLALLNERDREVGRPAVSGVTSLTDIGQIMGYRNHRAVSKRLARIREQAARILDAR